MRAILPFAAALGVITAAPALAQDSDLSDRLNGDSITIGVAGAYLPDYEGSDDYRIVPAPAAIGSVSGFNFLLAGNRLSVDLIPSQPGPTWDVQAGPLGVVNFNRNSLKSIDDVRIRALGKVDTAIELGGFVGLGKTGVITSPYDRLAVTVSYRHDVAGGHDSGIWQPSITYMTPLSRKALASIFVSGERAGGGYARSYFGVNQAQAVASGLPFYDARGGWKNWTLGALGAYSISGDLLQGWKLVGGVTYRKLLNDFGDSPVTRIAGSRSQWLGAVGLAYTF